MNERDGDTINCCPCEFSCVVSEESVFECTPVRVGTILPRISAPPHDPPSYCPARAWPVKSDLSRLNPTDSKLTEVPDVSLFLHPPSSPRSRSSFRCPPGGKRNVNHSRKNHYGKKRRESCRDSRVINRAPKGLSAARLLDDAQDVARIRQQANLRAKMEGVCWVASNWRVGGRKGVLSGKRFLVLCDNIVWAELREADRRCSLGEGGTSNGKWGGFPSVEAGGPGVCVGGGGGCIDFSGRASF